MSNYPNNLDLPKDLYVVQDSLRVVLSRDYNPGDDVIFIDGDTSLFPSEGIITLIDQCSDNDKKSVALKYKRKAPNAFLDIEVAEDSQASFKPKKITVVIMQLRAEHHNAIKDAIIAIQKFLGTKKDVDVEPFGSSIIGRINFLKGILYSPKAWFEVDKKVGLVPFECTFTSTSSGTKEAYGETEYIWDFGDGTQESNFSPTTLKTYFMPGIYDVKLTVKNVFGTDTITLQKIVTARMEAPEEAVVKFVPTEQQMLFEEEETYLRASTNQLITLEIPKGEDLEKCTTYAGEILINGQVVDPIVKYDWSLGDNLTHPNSPNTKAAYRVGGTYDLLLKTTTALGAYRTTRYKNCLDIVDIYNLWLWNFQNTNTVRAFEFGMLSETFKTRKTMYQTINIKDSFLDNVPNSERQKKEFKRNNGFAKREKKPSGAGSSCLLFWASGRDEIQPMASEKIEFMEYNGFTDTYFTPHEPIFRPWNWVALTSNTSIYFILGQINDRLPPAMSPTNNNRTDLDLTTMSNDSVDFNGYNYLNGAQELANNPAVFDDDGNISSGYFSVYRSTWKDKTGYFLRNEGVGEHLVIKSFYKTDGTLYSPFLNLIKLNDVPNGGRKECQLTTLSEGVYLFDNTGSVMMYSELKGTWETVPGNPGIFQQSQDRSMVDFNSSGQSLLVASDYYKKAFLSFDYSNKAFVGFNEADLTFNTIGSRPFGEQWQIGVY